MNLIIPTCETAVCTIPEWHRAAFKGKEQLVTSTTGWSPGALNLAQGVAIKVHAQLLHNEMTRLLIDLACHPEDPARWSETSMSLTEEQREKLDQRQKQPFLKALDARIENGRRQDQQPIHLSLDTRTGLGGAALVIEHDRNDALETDFAEKLADGIRQHQPDLFLRLDHREGYGLATWLHERHPGIVSLRILALQSTFLAGEPIAWASLKKAIVAAAAALR